MSKRQYEDRAKNWKCKAIIRRKENAYLKSRIKELTESRDKWKTKYKESKQSHEITLSKGKKAKGHHYSLSIVLFVTELYKYGSMSLRSCRHTIFCLYLILGLEGGLPCHNTIRNWLCKLGLHRLQNEVGQDKEYVIYVDESINFGSEKILLLLGVSTDKIPKNRSLYHSDVEVLGIEVSKEWKGEQVAQELEKVTTNKRVKYVVSDEGRNLKKAYKELNYTHIEDCTHIFANYLKGLYSSDEDFQAFSKLIGKLRQKWNLSKTHSCYMPPSMRGKLRFANIFPSVNWAEKMLQNWKDLPSDIQQQISFLKSNEDFIKGLVQVEKIFKTVCRDLKTTGFGELQKSTILNKLQKIQTQTDTGLKRDLEHKASMFIEKIKGYLDNLEAKRKELNEDFLLCASDIIESYFGKFKTKTNQNSRSGLTEFIFTIATFGKSFSMDEAQNALENIKCKELKLYRAKAKAA